MSRAIRNSLKSNEPFPSESNILKKSHFHYNILQERNFSLIFFLFSLFLSLNKKSLSVFICVIEPEYVLTKALSIALRKHFWKELQKMASRQLPIWTLWSEDKLSYNSHHAFQKHLNDRNQKSTVFSSKRVLFRQNSRSLFFRLFPVAGAFLNAGSRSGRGSAFGNGSGSGSSSGPFTWKWFWKDVNVCANLPHRWFFHFCTDLLIPKTLRIFIFSSFSTSSSTIELLRWRRLGIRRAGCSGSCSGSEPS